MIRTLIRAGAVLLGLASPALAQSTIGISGLPVATAVNPLTDYALGIVQQTGGNGLPFFVTSKVPLSKLVGPAGASPLLTGVNVTSLAPGAMPSGFIGGGFPNYVVNLALPSGPANVVLGQGTLVPGDFVVAGASGFNVVDGGTPGAAAFKGLPFFLQTANNLSDLPNPALARSALGLATVAASGSASDLGTGTLPAARLPAPTTSTLGGVNALPASGSAFLTGINASGLPTAAQPSFSNLSGSATAAQMPAFTGDVATSAGSTATTIQPGAVTNAKMASAPALTIKGNAGGAAGTVQDLTVAQSKALLGFASSGANSDITALSGLATPLSAGQGGTGAPSLSGALDATFGSAQGSILARFGSAWQVLAPGSAGQVLAASGAGANLSWVTPAGGTTGTQAANTFLGGPSSGAAASPSYRALVNTDLPTSAANTLRGNAMGASATATDLPAASALTVLGLNNTGQDSFRNRLRNGNFSINQRGVSGTVSLGAAVYGHDGWKGGASGATYTFAASGIDTVVSISANTLVQVTEAAKVEGGSYTLSWAGTAQCRATYTASGGSSTTTAYGASPLAVPATQPATAINTECGAGSGSGTVTLTRVQLEPGTSASAFERRDPSYELLLCRFYYQVIAFNWRTYASTGNGYPLPMTYATMRVAPGAAVSLVGSTNMASGYPTFTAAQAGGTLVFAAASAGGDTAGNGTVTLSAEL